MPKKQNSPVEVEDSNQEIERIRQIIFGPQLRKYDQRFQEAQSDLERLQQEIDRLQEQLADLSNDSGKKLTELRKEVRQSDDTIRSELRQSTERLTNEKVDRLALGELFVSLGNHLKSGDQLNELTAGSLSDLLSQLSDQG